MNKKELQQELVATQAKLDSINKDLEAIEKQEAELKEALTLVSNLVEAYNRVTNTICNSLVLFGDGSGFIEDIEDEKALVFCNIDTLMEKVVLNKIR